jgi:hypothetical protein
MLYYDNFRWLWFDKSKFKKTINYNYLITNIYVFLKESVESMYE